MNIASDHAPHLGYRLCPRCGRAMPTSSNERYCVNDGEKLLESCPACDAPIRSPYARFCAACGRPLAAPAADREPP